MTLPPLTLRIAQLLKDSEDGLTHAELQAGSGTRWIDRHLDALRRRGFTFGYETDNRIVLVHAPDSGEGAGPPESPSSPGLSGVSTAACALSGAERLFEVDERRAHWQEAA